MTSRCSEGQYKERQRWVKCNICLRGEIKARERLRMIRQRPRIIKQNGHRKRDDPRFVGDIIGHRSSKWMNPFVPTRFWNSDDITSDRLQDWHLPMTTEIDKSAFESNSKICEPVDSERQVGTRMRAQRKGIRQLELESEDHWLATSFTGNSVWSWNSEESRGLTFARPVLCCFSSKWRFDRHFHRKHNKGKVTTSCDRSENLLWFVGK